MMCNSEHKIKNFDKLKTEEERKIVLYWSELTNVTINDDGLFIVDSITTPGFKDAKIQIR